MDCSSSGSSVHGDSPGKNTREGCYALLQGVFPTQGSNPGRLHCRWILYQLSHQGSPRILEWVAYPFSRESPQPRSPVLQADSLLSEPPGKPKNTGVGSLSLLQRNFLTQQSNWGLLHCRQILYHLSHQGSPRILEWVAYPFSSGTLQSRNQTGVSSIAGRFFTS